MPSSWPPTTMAMTTMAGLQRSRQRDSVERSLGASGSAGTNEWQQIITSEDLPEEILEKIIAKVPFPSLLKARALSKGWRFKFSFSPSRQLPPLRDQDASSALSFRKEVSANAAKWGTYAPAFVNWTTSSLLGIDKSKTCQWLASLPSNIWLSQGKEWCPPGSRGPPMWFAGALLLIYGPRSSTYFVVNVITGSYRHLIEPPHLGGKGDICRQGPRSVIAVDCHTYKVLAMYLVLAEERNRVDALCVHLYDSKSQAWTSTLTKFNACPALRGVHHLFPHFAYIDGKAYFLACTYLLRGMLRILKLVSYDLENKVWANVVGGFADDRGRPAHVSGAYHCGEKVIVVIMLPTAVSGNQETSGWNIRKNSIRIFEYDIISKDMGLISEGPPGRVVMRLDGLPFFSLSADANFLCFGWECPSTPLFTFDVKRREWSDIRLVNPEPNSKRDMLSWVRGAFEPGFNPFVST